MAGNIGEEDQRKGPPLTKNMREGGRATIVYRDGSGKRDWQAVDEGGKTETCSTGSTGMTVVIVVSYLACSPPSVLDHLYYTASPGWKVQAGSGLAGQEQGNRTQQRNEELDSWGCWVQ